MATWSQVPAEDYSDYAGSDMVQVLRQVLDPIMIQELQPQGRTVLDVGCGEGYFGRILKRAGATRVVGSDISPDFIKKAKDQDPDGEYEVSDIASVRPLDHGAFDAVSACMVLMDLPDLDGAYRSISASLVPSGRFVASMVNPYYAFPVGEWGWALKDGLYGEFDPKHRGAKLIGRQVHGVLKGRFDSVLYIRNYFQSRVVAKTLGATSALHYHKPFSDYVNLAAKHGLDLRLLLEPQASPEVAQRSSEHWAHQYPPLAHTLTWAPLLFVLVFERRGE